MNTSRLNREHSSNTLARTNKTLKKNNGTLKRSSLSPNVVKPVTPTRQPEREAIKGGKNSNVEKFHHAINSGNLEEVKKIIEEGQTKINARDSSQNTPLHSAIIADKFEIAHYLISEGANPALTNEGGNTCLHVACNSSSTNYIDLIVSSSSSSSSPSPSSPSPSPASPSPSASPSSPSPSSPSSLSPSNKSAPLITSVSAPTVSTRNLLRQHTFQISSSNLLSPLSSSLSVLNAGGLSSPTGILTPPISTFINKLNARGNTALHCACFNGSYEAIKILMSKGAEMIPNSEGWTPLHHAASMGHALVISTILSRASNSNSNSNLSLSLSASSLQMANVKDTLGRTPIFLAAAGGHTEAVQALAKAGGNLNVPSESGDTPLHMAIRHISSLQSPNPDLSLIKILLNLNANVCAVSKSGNAPLHIACLYGAYGIVELLLQQSRITKQEVNQENKKRHSPLFLTVMRPAYHHFTPYQGSREKDRLCIVKSLLLAGAQVTTSKKASGKGKTVLHAAAKNGFGEIIRFLTTSFPPPAPVRRIHSGLSPSSNTIINNLNNAPRLGVELMGNNGEKMPEASVIIIEEALKNIDPAVQDNMGRTPLHYAALAGSEVCVNVFVRSIGAKLSLPLAQDSEGSTPLHLAALHGHTTICEILIRETEAPDLVHLCDNLGNSPLHYAAWGKSSETVHAILTRGGLASQANHKYQTPFHMACISPPTRKTGTYFESNWISESLRICNFLIEYGADIHAEDDLGWTPLDYALTSPQAHLPPIPPFTAATNVTSSPSISPRPDSPQLAASSSPTLTFSSSPKILRPLHQIPRITSSTPAINGGGLDDDKAVCIARALIDRGANTHTRDVRTDHAMHRAVAGACPDCVRLLLEKGEDVQALGAKDRTPLHIAASLGHATLVNILLEYGANTHAITSARLTPLHLAARCGSLTTAELLISRGAAVDIGCVRDWTPLHHACASGHLLVASLLIDHGADVNRADATGRTPLHKATYYSHPEVVMVLVERGANPNAEDEDGETPVHYASIRGLSAALIFMSAIGTDQVGNRTGADLAILTRKGSAPIHLAARYEHVDTAMFLMEKDRSVLAAVTRKGRSPLHVAARYGKATMTQVLLEHGADSNATDIDGNTPLHLAAQGGVEEVVVHLLAPNKHTQGADPNASNMDGLTPLHTVVLQCRPPERTVQLVQRLAQAGANLNARDKLGRSPLVCALQALNFESAHKLLELGCSTDGTDEDGRTVLHVAALHNASSFLQSLLSPSTITPLSSVPSSPPSSPHLSSSLSSISPPSLHRPFSPFHRDAEDNTALHSAANTGALESVEFLVKFIEKSDSENKDEKLREFLETTNYLGRTALHTASFYGHSTVVEFLVSKGAIIDALDITQSTPLHLATAAGYDSCVSILISAGANPSAFSDKGYYIIHTAAAGGNVKVVEQILEQRPEDILAVTGEGDTPLHIAVKYGHLTVASNLLSHNTESLDAPNYSGASPVHLAALHGRSAILNLLVEKLANINLPDNQGRKPLHFAAMSNQKECASILLRRGVHPSQQDNDGRTPLHLAAARGQKALVSLLLSYNGVEPNALDKEDGTPLAYAQANEHIECIELLEMHREKR